MILEIKLQLIWIQFLFIYFKVYVTHIVSELIY